jgi:hypothetical protein
MKHFERAPEPSDRETPQDQNMLIDDSLQGLENKLVVAFGQLNAAMQIGLN